MKCVKNIIIEKKFALVWLITLGALVSLGITYTCYTRTYHSDLTAKVYNDTINENVNIVFYKKGCPYCEAGMSKIKSEAKRSDVTTFYVDVESPDGVKLVNRFGVAKASTLIMIRNGAITQESYVVAKNGRIVHRSRFIEKAFRKD